jgi:D-3-phosphoglycerate dehydrogenase/(S)-sulfolactate dehydrogenase
VSAAEVDTAEVVVAENVWGEPFEHLAAARTLARRADAGDLTGARALVVRNRTQVDAALLDAAPSLQVVGRAGVGLDNIDLAAADEHGVVVVAPLGANAVSVAEHTLALVLAVFRGIPGHDRDVRAGQWRRTPGRELAGRTWGLLGYGATGRAVARLAGAFGMRVMAYDPYVDTAVDVELVDLETVLAESDVLSVHLPATPQTRGLLGADTLSRMRHGAVLVSVGRGEVVDEDALAAALHARRLSGAGLDVRASEPPAPGPLDAAPNVIFTPHVAGITVESQQRIASVLVDDINSVLDGAEAAHAVGQHKRGRAR